MVSWPTYPSPYNHQAPPFTQGGPGTTCAAPTCAVWALPSQHSNFFTTFQDFTRLVLNDALLEMYNPSPVLPKMGPDLFQQPKPQPFIYPPHNPYVPSEAQRCSSALGKGREDLEQTQGSAQSLGQVGRPHQAAMWLLLQRQECGWNSVCTGSSLHCLEVSPTNTPLSSPTISLEEFKSILNQFKNTNETYCAAVLVIILKT